MLQRGRWRFLPHSRPWNRLCTKYISTWGQEESRLLAANRVKQKSTKTVANITRLKMMVYSMNRKIWIENGLTRPSSCPGWRRSPCFLGFSQSPMLTISLTSESVTFNTIVYGSWRQCIMCSVQHLRAWGVSGSILRKKGWSWKPAKKMPPMASASDGWAKSRFKLFFLARGIVDVGFFMQRRTRWKGKGMVWSLVIDLLKSSAWVMTVEAGHGGVSCLECRIECTAL